MHAGIPPPDQAGTLWDQAGTPRDQAPTWTRHLPPPPDQSMLGDTVNERAVRILLECILVMDEIAVFITKTILIFWSFCSISCHYLPLKTLHICRIANKFLQDSYMILLQTSLSDLADLTKRFLSCKTRGLQVKTDKTNYINTVPCDSLWNTWTGKFLHLLKFL